MDGFVTLKFKKKMLFKYANSDIIYYFFEIIKPWI